MIGYLIKQKLSATSSAESFFIRLYSSVNLMPKSDRGVLKTRQQGTYPFNESLTKVSKTVLRSVLRKTHHEKLIVAGQIPGTIVSLVLGDARVEVSTRYKRHKLSKYGFSCEHRQTNQLVSPKLRFKSCTRKPLVIN